MDLWDCVAVVGLSLVLVGVGFIFWPAALILGGTITVAAYYLRERSLVPHSPPPREHAEQE